LFESAPHIVCEKTRKERYIGSFAEASSRQFNGVHAATSLKKAGMMSHKGFDINAFLHESKFSVNKHLRKTRVADAFFSSAVPIRNNCLLYPT